MAAVVMPTGARPDVRTITTKRPTFHIPSLDGIRAASFLVVFLAHAGLGPVPGGFGVTVFFFLSGYLITTLMRMEADRTGHVSLTHFYLRRALRILPPFYIVLLSATWLGAIGILPGNPRPQPLPVLSQALHASNYWIAAHGWGGIATGTGVYWSLAVEEHFYVIFPAIFLVLSRLGLTGKQKAFCFWGACILVLAWRTALVFRFHVGVDRTYLCSDTRVDSILFGCALAVWNNPILDRGAEGQAEKYALFVLPCALLTLLLTFVVRENSFRETLRYSLQGVALTPIFIAAVRWPGWPVFRLLNTRVMKFVGTLSYSLYLVHQATLAVVEQHLPFGRSGRAVLALLASILIAWAMYRLVERPCARVRKRLSAAGE